MINVPMTCFSTTDINTTEQQRKDKINRMTTALVGGDRLALSRAITLVESANEQHYSLAQDLLADALDKIHSQQDANTKGTPQDLATRTIRLGIAGPPGAGKSTFIEALGTHLIQERGQ